MSILWILSQVVIAIVVVAIYHLWFSGGKPIASAPPIVEAPAVKPIPVPAPPAAPVLPVLIAPVVVAPKVAVAEAGPAPEIIAVIAAAVAVVLGRPHRVLAVQSGPPLSPEVNVWALEGRVEQFMSHRVR